VDVVVDVNVNVVDDRRIVHVHVHVHDYDHDHDEV
jgi:hypothetical protein